jgi:hypothetical protein
MPGQPDVRVRLGDVDYQAFPVGDGFSYVPGLDASLRFERAADARPVLHWLAVFTGALVVTATEP